MSKKTMSDKKLKNISMITVTNETRQTVQTVLLPNGAVISPYLRVNGPIQATSILNAPELREGGSPITPAGFTFTPDVMLIKSTDAGVALPDRETDVIDLISSFGFDRTIEYNGHASLESSLTGSYTYRSLFLQMTASANSSDILYADIPRGPWGNQALAQTGSSGSISFFTAADLSGGSLALKLEFGKNPFGDVRYRCLSMTQYLSSSTNEVLRSVNIYNSLIAKGASKTSKATRVFTVKKLEKGAQGTQGPQGATGAGGADGVSVDVTVLPSHPDVTTLGSTGHALVTVSVSGSLLQCWDTTGTIANNQFYVTGSDAYWGIANIDAPQGAFTSADDFYYTQRFTSTTARIWPKNWASGYGWGSNIFILYYKRNNSISARWVNISWSRPDPGLSTSYYIPYKSNPNVGLGDMGDGFGIKLASTEFYSEHHFKQWRAEVMDYAWFTGDTEYRRLIMGGGLELAPFHSSKTDALASAGGSIIRRNIKNKWYHHSGSVSWLDTDSPGTDGVFKLTNGRYSIRFVCGTRMEDQDEWTNGSDTNLLVSQSLSRNIGLRFTAVVLSKPSAANWNIKTGAAAFWDSIPATGSIANTFLNKSDQWTGSSATNGGFLSGSANMAYNDGADTGWLNYDSNNDRISPKLPWDMSSDLDLHGVTHPDNGIRSFNVDLSNAGMISGYSDSGYFGLAIVAESKYYYANDALRCGSMIKTFLSTTFPFDVIKNSPDYPLGAGLDGDGESNPQYVGTYLVITKVQ